MVTNKTSNRMKTPSNGTLFNMSWLELKLDDDPETLRAALELIDATVSTSDDDSIVWEANWDSEGVTTSDSADEKPIAETVKMPAVRPLRTERKRKHDIGLLKQNVVVLESKLGDLRCQRQRDDTLSLLEAVDVTGEQVWKDIAKRQRMERYTAEVKNQNLRAMIHSQALVGQQLLHLLQHTASHDAQVKKELKQEAEPTAEQTRHLEELLGQSDRVFASECFHTSRLSFHDVRVNEEGSNGMVVDTFAGWIVPLSTEKVISALWSGMMHAEPTSMCKSIRMDMELKDDTLIASYTLSATMPDRTYAGCTGTAVSRRYRAADGATFIISMMNGEMLGSIPGSQDTIQAIELHWMRIRPHQSLGESELTQVQLNRQVRLTFSANHSPKRRNIVNAVIEMVLLQAEEDITFKKQLVERVLLLGATN